MTGIVIFVSVFDIKGIKARFRVRVQYSISESSTKQTLNKSLFFNWTRCNIMTCEVLKKDKE